MPGKVCDRCKAPFKGYGTTCSPCRRQPGPEWGPCSACGAYFCGYGGVCGECRAGPPGGEGSVASAMEGGAGPAAAPPPAEEIKDCSACSEPIGLQQYVSSHGQAFHEKCFTCRGCQAVLSRAHAVAPGGGRLCGACAPTCGSCEKHVIGKIVKANGSCYHPECFTCDFCGKELSGNYLNDSRGRTVCQSCHEQPREDPPKLSQKFQQQLGALDDGLGEFAHDRCSACCELLGDDQMMVRGDRYHPACFTCFICGDQLAGGYSVLNYKDVCLPCASKAGKDAAPSCIKCGNVISGQFRATHDGPVCAECGPSLQCSGCGQPIEGKCSQVGEKSYHPECFTCRACGTSLAGGFCPIEGDFFCGGCAQKKQAEQLAEAAGTCAKCSAALCGGYVDTGNGDRFHESCFTCDGCGQALEAFVLQEGQGKRRYLCEGCA